MQDKQEWVAFDDTFSRIVDEIAPKNCTSELKKTKNWIRYVMESNVPHGKRNRGLAVVSTYRTLMEQNLSQTIVEQKLELARVLGWCVEMLQTYLLVIDDIMDQSVTRRGQPCWYKREDVGLIACNDAIMIDAEIYHLIKLYCGETERYTDIVDLFHDITRYTCYGQCMDLMSSPPNGRPQIEKFTEDRYENIVRYKTSYYTFVLPVRLAMLLANWNNADEHELAEQVLLKMGYLFQMQDDYLDCFGDADVIGKIGTDIEEGKCCWPIITALKLCDDNQRKELNLFYGNKEKEAVERVKCIYKQLDLMRIYHELEESLYDELCLLIADVSKKSKLNASIFYDMLSKIYHRDK